MSANAWAQFLPGASPGGPLRPFTGAKNGGTVRIAQCPKCNRRNGILYICSGRYLCACPACDSSRIRTFMRGPVPEDGYTTEGEAIRQWTCKGERVKSC